MLELRFLCSNHPSSTFNYYFTSLAIPSLIWYKCSNIAVFSLQHVIEGGGINLLLLTLLKKAREFLMFSQPFDKITRCTASAFHACWSFFSYSYNYRSSSTMLVSTSDLDPSFLAATLSYFYTVLSTFKKFLLNSSTSTKINFFFSFVFSMILFTLLVTSLESCFLISSSRWSNSFFPLLQRCKSLFNCLIASPGQASPYAYHLIQSIVSSPPPIYLLVYACLPLTPILSFFLLVSTFLHYSMS